MNQTQNIAALACFAAGLTLEEISRDLQIDAEEILRQHIRCNMPPLGTVAPRVEAPPAPAQAEARTKICDDHPQSGFYSNGSCRECQKAKARKRYMDTHPEAEVLPPGSKRCTACKNVKDATEFSIDRAGRKQRCRECTREAERKPDGEKRKRGRPRKEPLAAAPAAERSEPPPSQAPALSAVPVRPAAVAGPESARGYEYSRLYKCSRCGTSSVRFRRAVGATPNDYWTCMAGGCQLKISHVQIRVDRGYEAA